jgi:urea transport system ATP-binding protein
MSPLIQFKKGPHLDRWLDGFVPSQGLENDARSGDLTGLGHILKPNTIDTSHGDILYIEGLTVRFDGFRAINNLNLYIRSGELRCVIGPNGAGKTTLMDVITGKTGPRNASIEGRVFLGQTLDLLNLREPQIAQLGIGRKFQKPTVFEAFSVCQNLAMAQKGQRSWLYSLAHRSDTALESALDETLERIKLTTQAHQTAGSLSHGQKQRLEIGMLLMQKPELLLLDEPAAGMTDEETVELAQLLNTLRGTCSMMVVEHDMTFVEALAGDTGTVTVLAEGSVLAEGTLAKVKADPLVIESYLGR